VAVANFSSGRTGTDRRHPRANEAERAEDGRTWVAWPQEPELLRPGYGSRHRYSAWRPRATLPGAAGTPGERRPGKPRRDPCFWALHGAWTRRDPGR